MEKHVKFLKASGPTCNAIRCEVYYHLGGLNYFTYKNEQRGYYVSASPVEKKGMCETYVGFSGIKNCIVPVNRQSKSAESKAVEMMDEALKPMLDYLRTKGYTISDEEF